MKNPPSQTVMAGRTGVAATSKHEEALADMEDVRKAVFGDVGDEPNVYADYDRCSELSGKMRRALAILADPPEPRAEAEALKIAASEGKP